MNTTLTQEQKTARLGKFKGSENYKLMDVKGFGKTGETYIIETVSEYLTGQPIKPEFTSQATQWGIDHEPEAKLHFEAATGLKIEIVGTKNNDLIVGTPDGKILDASIGFEIKCPYNQGNHVKNLLLTDQVGLLELHPEYFWQIYSYMWIFGWDQYKFCSYDPRFKEEKRMMILNIQKEENYMKALQARVTEAKLMFENILSKLK